MISFLKKLFTPKPKVNFKTLISNGAIIIDVRTPNEFNSGHCKTSVNMPLSNLATTLTTLIPNSTIITCCASGMRSGVAKKLLKTNGFTNVYNSGGYKTLQLQLL